MIAHAIIRLEDWMPNWWFCFFIFNWQVMTTVLLFLLLLIGPSINPIRQGIQWSLVFWIPLRGFRVPAVLCTWFQIFVSGTWIPDFNLPWDFGFQIPGFRGFRGFANMGRFDVQGSFKMFACGQNKTRYRSGAYSSSRVALLLLNRCWWPI